MDTKVASEVKEIFEVLNERIKGYEKAAENVKSPEYKSLFQQRSSESRSFEEELIPYSDKRPEDAGTRMQGDAWRFWMDIKSALSTNDDKAMLKACISGEEAAIDKYQSVLEDKEMPINVRSKLEEQLREIRAAHGNLVRLRDIE